MWVGCEEKYEVEENKKWTNISFETECFVLSKYSGMGSQAEVAVLLFMRETVFIEDKNIAISMSIGKTFLKK